MVASEGSPSKYSPPAVERAVLEVVSSRHPGHLHRGDLVREIVSDVEDRREVETLDAAIRNLAELGLIREHDGTVEPTSPLLRIVDLFGIP